MAQSRAECTAQTETPWRDEADELKKSWKIHSLFFFFFLHIIFQVEFYMFIKVQVRVGQTRSSSLVGLVFLTHSGSLSRLAGPPELSKSPSNLILLIVNRICSLVWMRSCSYKYIGKWLCKKIYMVDQFPNKLLTFVSKKCLKSSKYCTLSPSTTMNVQFKIIFPYSISISHSNELTAKISRVLLKVSGMSKIHVREQHSSQSWVHSKISHTQKTRLRMFN